MRSPPVPGPDRRDDPGRRPDPLTEERALRHHALARDLLESVELLHRNLKDRQAAPLLRQAIDEELRALAVALGSGAEGAERPPGHALASDSGVDLPALLAALDEIAARAASDPAAAPSRRLFRRLIEETTRFVHRADRALAAVLRGQRQRLVRRAAWRAFLAIVAAAALVATVVLTWRALVTGHQGLVGVYFAGTELEHERTQQVDPRIDFNWTGLSPAPGVPAESFSVRWTGEVRAPVDGTYHFAVASDDGARLWLGDRQLVDAWVLQQVTSHGAAVELATGWHSIRLEYFQAGTGAICRLLWTPPGGVEQVVPEEYLRPR
ncbi:MAG TPA: PA14 domain-containing protein [Thermoanaerobaculia bacterium]|nr:PA14 domain-containing protein [Thermoanaerobaculia bacterium]